MCLQVMSWFKIKTTGVNIFFVDLLLPNYDIKQGHTLYDEVLAVEYCIEMSNLLVGKSSILVRNEITLESVQRVINAREQEKMRERERRGGKKRKGKRKKRS